MGPAPCLELQPYQADHLKMVHSGPKGPARGPPSGGPTPVWPIPNNLMGEQTGGTQGARVVWERGKHTGKQPGVTNWGDRTTNKGTRRETIEGIKTDKTKQGSQQQGIT